MSAQEASKRPEDGCPSLDQLRAFAVGGLLEADARRVRDHVSRCSRCGALLLALPEAGPGVVDSLRPAPPESPTAVASPGPGDTTGPCGVGRAVGPRALCLGRYTIRRQIGQGGFGVVYAARDEELDRLVAVKMPYSDRRLSPEVLRDYHGEARLHASLDHPHIVPIYDVGRTEAVPFYMVSKLIDGEDLAARIKRDRPGPRQAAALLVPLAEALEHLHGRGLVHRDVKPRNILLDSTGTPYLADFGLAVRATPTQAAPAGMAGTPAYMSPEQARGEGPRVDRRTDVYSLGVVLYELLTGARPFRGDGEELRQKVLREEPTAPRALAPDVPVDLERICLKAMAKDPRQRYQRAAHLAEDLRSFLAGEPARPASWLRRHAALALAGALARPTPPVAPDTPPLAVVLETRPAGAQLSWFPLDGRTGEPLPERVTRGRAGAEVLLAPGRYLVVAVLPGKPQRFHEVLRQVPEHPGGMTRPFRHQSWKTIDGVVHLESVVIPPAAVTRWMCLFPPSEGFTMGSAELRTGKVALAPPRRCRVPAFYLDTTEVTAGDYRPWLLGRKLDPSPGDADRRPATHVTWDHAVAYAERVGKRLPDEVEYEYAATGCGKRRFPWGSSAAPLEGRKWTFGPVGEPAYDVLELPGQWPVFGLYSNVAEWTGSWLGDPGGERPEPASAVRVVRGAPYSVLNGDPVLRQPPLGPRERYGVAGPVTRPGLGFRCARSVRPRLTARDFIAALPR
jgi:hypothetical protein